MSQTQYELSQTDNQSERQKVDEYIAALNVEKEQNHVNTFVRDLYVLPVGALKSRSNYRKRDKCNMSSLCEKIKQGTIADVGWFDFHIICKIYLPTRNKTVYVYINNFKDLYNIFPESFSISNIIDQDVEYSNPEKANIKINSDTVEFKNHSKKEFSYENSIKSIFHDLDLSYGCYLDMDYDLLNMNLVFNDIDKCVDKMFEKYEHPDNAITQRIHVVSNFKSGIKYFTNKTKTYSINDKYLDARISKCKVDNRIEIFVEVEDISHKEPLRFYFKKPSSNGESKFINFINEMGINSVAELETHPVTLCRYSDNEMV